MGKFLTRLKDEWPELKELYSKCLQPVRDRLFHNLRVLEKTNKPGKKIGKLRYKNDNSFKSFTYNQVGFKLIPKNNKYGFLHLSKIGNIPIRLHRVIDGEIKEVTVKHMPSRKWYAYIIVEDGSIPSRQPNLEKAVGLDFGLSSLITDSDGNEVENPRFLKQALKKLKREHRRLSKKEVGGKNREKQRIKLALQYEKVQNQRNDHQHKVARMYVDNYDFIVVERLRPMDMAHGRSLSRSISDASWASLKRKIAYKAEKAGKLIYQVDPKGTTQQCSRCGKLVPKSLKDRWHDCPHCGLHLSRDRNASINILRRGIEKVGQELPELACGHWTATPLHLEVQARWMKQEAPVAG
jgi:putative transposase